MQFLRVERCVDLFAFFSQLNNELIKFSKLSFEFFHLHHHLGQVLVTSLRRIANVQVVHNRLANQFQLTVEFSSAFNGQQRLRLLFQRGASLVQTRVNRRDIVNDPRPLRGVFDLQVTDNLNQHLKFARTSGDFFIQFLRLQTGLEGFDLLQLVFDSFCIRVE